MSNKMITAFIRSFLLLSLLFGVSLLTLWQVFSPLSVSSLRTEYGVIEENGKGLFFHTGDIRTPLFKVSPFDDYIYHTDGTKVHIFDNYYFNDTGTVHTFSDALTYYFQQLTRPQHSFDWTITGPDGTVHYNASWVERGITIERTVSEPKKPIAAYGNSVVICTTCFITSGNAAYFTGVYTTNKKVLESLHTAFTPVLISSALPTTVTNITVRNSRGDALFSEQAPGGISYEEPWHLVEVLSPQKKQVITLTP